MAKKLSLFSSEQGGRIQAFFGTLAGVLLILFVSLLLVVRTPFFRTLTIERIEKRTGLKLEIEKISMGLPFDLVLREGRTTAGTGAAAASVAFEELRVGLLPLGVFSRKSGLLRRLHVRKLKATLVRRSGGAGWDPAVFDGLGDVSSVESLLFLSDRVRKNLNLKIENGDIRWRDAQGRESAYAAGFDCTVTPLALPRRKACHWLVRVDRALMPPGSGIAGGAPALGAVQSVPGLELEWIAVEGGHHFLIGLSDESGQPQAGAIGREEQR